MTSKAYLRLLVYEIYSMKSTKFYFKGHLDKKNIMSPLDIVLQSKTIVNTGQIKPAYSIFPSSLKMYPKAANQSKVPF